jgi:hypothetical protein
MGNRSTALIGFYGDDLDPDEITKTFGLEPSIGVRKGGAWKTSMGTVKIAHTGSWRLKCDGAEPDDLSGQLRSLLARMPDDLEIWQTFASQYRAVAFCGLWLQSYNDGLQLPSDVLSALGARGLSIDVDIYAPDHE